MNTTITRRLGVLAAGALTLSGLAVTGSSPAGAVAPGADPAPAAASVAWLTSQLKNGGVLTSPYQGVEYDLVGATIDAALGAKLVGDTAALTSLRDAVAAKVGDYTGTDANTAAGQTAKAAYLAQQSGANASSFGGTDLIAKLVPQVITSGPSTGRLQDDVDPADQFDADYGNVLSQSYAVAALTSAGPSTASTAAAATTFLLTQQCTAGYFTGSDGFAQVDKAAADQTCQGNAAPASVDATATAVVALSAQPTNANATAARDRAVAWLQSVQAADGSFRPGGAPTGGGNAASTGLAGAALGQAGATQAAQRAALWIRGQQLANAGACTTVAAADNGAVAQDASALTAVASTPVAASGDAVVSQFRVATAQSLGALAYAPGGAAAGATTLSSARFAKAGATGAAVTVTGAPGNTVCFTSGGRSVKKVLDAAGGTAFTLALPATEGTATASLVDAGGEVDTVSVRVLAKKTVKLKLPSARAATGSKALVKVRGLEAGERVVVKLRGKKVVTTANAQGRKTVRIKVTGKPGRAKLVVKGEYGNRSGKQVIRVVR